MAKKGSTKGKRERYDRYKMQGSYVKNKRAKINRHIKKHPNDAQSARALNDIHYRRKAPKGIH